MLSPPPPACKSPPFRYKCGRIPIATAFRSHQFGWKVCLQIGINREFVQPKVCRSQDDVLTTGEQWRAAKIEKGWA